MQSQQYIRAGKIRNPIKQNNGIRAMETICYPVIDNQRVALSNRINNSVTSKNSIVF